MWEVSAPNLCIVQGPTVTHMRLYPMISSAFFISKKKWDESFLANTKKIFLIGKKKIEYVIGKRHPVSGTGGL